VVVDGTLMWALHQGLGGPRCVEKAPVLRPGEARVAVRLAGVCATDLELVKGYMAFEGTLGHEWVGEVLDAPDPAWIGRRVVGDINCACGHCATCLAGRPSHCPNRTVLGIVGRDGAFAEELSLPVGNLHPVPDGVPDEAAVFVEPLAAACEILEQVAVRPSMRVVVLGSGRLGQLCARVLALSGAEVAVVGRNPTTMALLPRGIRRVDSTEAATVNGADLVVDCTGSPDGLGLASSLVRARGTIVLKTTVHDVGTMNPNRWVIEEQTIVGSRCGPFAPALRLLASGAVDPRPLISAHYPLREGVAALARAAEPGVVKVLVEVP
jgi:alcohol dehydrogenase